MYISELWVTEDGYARITCLEVVKKSGCNEELFKQYKKVLLNSHDEAIRLWVEKFNKGFIKFESINRKNK